MTQNTYWANNYRKQRMADWFNPPVLSAEIKAKDLKSFINNQNYIKRDYGERVLLELLQNVDDAANASTDSTATSAKFILDGRILKILNQGAPFNSEKLEAICISHISTKPEEESVNTGSKGIGFRGILNWAENVKIYSGDYAVCFSQTECKKEFESYKDTDVYKRISASEENWSNNFPFLAIPFNTNFPIEWQNGKYVDGDTCYDTCIEITLQEDAIETYRRSVRHFISKEIASMLFLLKIQNICFIDKTDGCENEICLKTQKNGMVHQTNGLIYSVTTITDGESAHEYHLFNKGAETIAIPFEWEKNKANKYTLYSTFPINDQDCPFPVIMNSRDFDLISNRNSLTNSKNNKIIIQKLQDMLIKQVAPYFAKSEFGNQALEMVAYDNNIDRTSFKDNIDTIDKDIAQQDIILTMDGKYKNLNGELKNIYYEDYPHFMTNYDNCCFITDEVYNLLDFSENLQNKIHLLSEPEDLYDFINEQYSKWNLQQRIKVLLFWLNNFSTANMLPNLIKTKNDEFFTFCSSEHQIPFFYSGSKIQSLPEWLTLAIIKEEDQKELFKQFKETLSQENTEPLERVISHKYPNFFNYMDKNRLSKEINNQVNNDFNKAVDFIKFLYNNYKNEKNISNESDDIEWHIPTATGEVINPNKACFGIEYGENIGIKICAAAGLTSIPSLQLFDIPPEEIENFKRVIKSFLKVRDNILPREAPIVDEMYKHEVMRASGRDVKNIKGTTIPELPSILTNAEQFLILDWLKEYIVHQIIPSDSIRCNYDRYNAFYQTMNNHIVYQLLRTNWINIDGQKISPLYCLVPPERKNTYPAGLVNFIPEYKKYKTLWDLLNINQYIYQLPDDTFYGILLKLPQIDTKGEISEKIYREIANADLDNLSHLTSSHCENKQNFFSSGQLFANNRITTKFYPIAEGIYFSNIKNINPTNQPIMKTPLRTGSIDKFKDIFNVSEYKENILANYKECTKHIDNSQFEQDFQAFKPFLRALDATDELNSAIPNITISLCSDIPILNVSTDTNITFNDYDIVRAKNNKFCIFLNKTSRLDIPNVAHKIGEICDIISKSKDIIDTVTALYLQGSNENRKRFLEEKGCDISLLSEYKDIKQSFIDTILEICPDTNTEELLQIYPINFDDFKSSGNLQSIRSILTKLNTDVLTFQEHGFNDINFEASNRQLLINYINDNIRQYKEYLYNELFDKTIAEQEQFESKLYDFQQHAGDIVPNIHNFNPSEYLPIPQSVKRHDFTDNILETNYQHFIQQCPDKQIAVCLINDDSNKSLLWFKCFDELRARYDNLVAQKNEQNIESKENNESVATTILNIQQHNVTDIDEQTPIKQHSTHVADRKRTKKQFDQSINDKKQQKGKEAEQMVYNTLKTHYSEVIWENGNAALAHNIIGTGDDSAGYDMKYKDENGNWQYVEVKHATHTNNNYYSFIITANEERFARAHIDNYNLFLVIDSQNARCLTGQQVLHYINIAEIEQKTCYIPQ